MLSRLIHFIKIKNYTLRFSILSIFVVLLTISMASLISLMYIRAMDNITYFAFNLMKQISSDTFVGIDTELQKIEIKNKSAAKVIMSGVINLNSKDNDEMRRYTLHVLHNEGALFPILQSILWSDTKGNAVMADKQEDGSIKLETINQSKNKTINQYYYPNLLNDSFKIVPAPVIHYNPTLSPWYLETIKNNKTTWVDVYRYQLSKYLGVSVATPVFSKQGVILGVIKFDVRLDFLRKLVENVAFSKNGIVFIVTKDAKLIAFPHILQYKNEKVMNIHQLNQYPWIISSFEHYLKFGESSFIFEFNKNQYLASYNYFAKLGKSEWLIGTVAPKDDFVYELRKTTKMSILFGLLILLGSIFVVSSIISRVVKPMRKITNEIDKIRNFDLTHTPKIESRIKEVSYMASALYSMKKGLRSFQKYVPSSLVRDLIEAGEEVKIGGVKKPLAIFFTDIYNFTSIAETSDPHLLAARICDYFDVLSAIITKQHGTIDKYIGDSIMAFWGAPLDIDQPCHKAAKAALFCMKQLTILNNLWENENKPAFFTSIGIHYGEAIVGNFGSSERLSYTAFGDSVNLASRLQNINHYFGTYIIVSESVYQAIKDHFVLRMLDRITVKGKAEAINIYELIGDDSNRVGYDINAYRTIFSKGFSAYKNRYWDEASNYFKECLSIYKDDVVSPLFIARCEKYKLEPPADNWQGVRHLDKKPV